MDLKHITAQLLADDVPTRLAGLAALEEYDERPSLPPEVLRGLLSCLGYTKKTVQRTAAALLVRFAGKQPEIITALTQELADLDPRVRWTAAFTLAQIDLPEPFPLPVLIENLGHEESDLRWAAATAILRLVGQHPHIIVNLCHLAGTGNPVQRRMALYCLRDLAQTGVEARAVYRTGLSDPDSGVRLAALSCVGKLRLAAPEVGETIIRLLEADPDLGVRRAAAATLGQLGDASPAVIVVLTKAMHSDDVGLGKAAAGSLAKLPKSDTGTRGLGDTGKRGE